MIYRQIPGHTQYGAGYFATRVPPTDILFASEIILTLVVDYMPNRPAQYFCVSVNAPASLDLSTLRHVHHFLLTPTPPLSVIFRRSGYGV